MKRIFAYAWTNFIRNGFVSLATVLVISVIIFIFKVATLVSNLSEAVVTAINKKVDLIVELHEEADQVLVQSILKDLGRMPEVEKVQHISKAEAFENFKNNHPEKAEFLEKYSLNPLPPQFQITTTDPTSHEKIISFLSQKRFRDVLDADKLKRKVVLFAFLQKEVLAAEVMEDVQDSEDILAASKVPRDLKEEVFRKIFPESELDENFIAKEDLLDLDILEIESEYPGKNLKAKEFLLSTFFKNKILLLKEPIKERDTKSSSVTERVSEWIILFTQYVNSIRIWVLVGMLVCGVIIVINAIHLSIAMRQEEIEIMKLVGAHFSFIRTPFLIEGALYGFFSALASIIIFALVLGVVSSKEHYDIFFLSRENYQAAIFLGDFVLWEILGAIFLGILSSYLATLKYLNFSRGK